MGTFIQSKFTSTDATAPKLIVDYAYDDFERADGTVLGSTSIGGKPWTAEGGMTYALAGGKMTATGTNTGLATGLYIDTPELDGRITYKTPAPGSQSSLHGCMFRASSTGTGYVFYGPEAGVYALRKRTSTSAMSTVVASTKAVANNDAVEIELTGNRIVAKVNGVTIIDVVDASYPAGTRKGLWVYDTALPNAAAWDYFGWSAL